MASTTMSKAKLKSLNNETGKPYEEWDFNDHLVHVIRVMSERCGYNSISIKDEIFTIKEEKDTSHHFNGHTVYVSRECLERCNSLTYWTIIRRCLESLLNERKISVSTECREYLKYRIDISGTQGIFNDIVSYNNFLEEMYLDGETYKLQAYWGKVSDYIPDAPEGDEVGAAKVTIKRGYLAELFEDDKRRASENAMRVARSVGASLRGRDTYQKRSRTSRDPYFTRSSIDRCISFFRIRNIYGYGPFDWGNKLRLIIRAFSGDKSLFETVHVRKKEETIKKMRSNSDADGNIKCDTEDEIIVVREERFNVEQAEKDFINSGFKEYIPYLEIACNKYQKTTFESEKEPAKRVGEYLLDLIRMSANVRKGIRPISIEHEFGNAAKNNAIIEFNDSSTLKSMYSDFDTYWENVKYDKIYELIKDKTVDHKFADTVMNKVSKINRRNGVK